VCVCVCVCVCGWHCLCGCLAAPCLTTLNQMRKQFVDRRLAQGMATGAVRFPTMDGSGVLRVRVGERGRGLFAVSPIRKGEDFIHFVYVLLKVRCFAGQEITQGSGKLIPRTDDAPDCQQYSWFDKQNFVFDPPSDGNLAVLVNAPLGGALSNARYVRVKKKVLMKVGTLWSHV